MENYSMFNARPVLEAVEEKIAMIERGEAKSFRIKNVCKELSIFDWWPETLSKSRLVQMRDFLRTAIKLGFGGYVCFKVGSAGCSNGMWAYTDASPNGHAPKSGDVIYRSFTPSYTRWSFTVDGKWQDENGEHRDYDSETDFLLELMAARMNSRFDLAV